MLLRISCSLILCAVFAADARIPGKAWEKRRGSNWSDAKLKAAREYAGTLKTSAVLIVQDGAIVDEWGDVTKKYLCHSIRKSFLSALYGIAAAGGKIDISKTLEDLGIDDNEPSLTAEEKRASVGDLLKARSGVYHPALAETASMKAVRPLRGSHSPGTFWYYNNWDFNALGAIYEKLTQEKIHESFERRIAQPIGMESYSTSDGSYSRGPDSIHPAYPFKMSTRDLARFGVLFLNQGRWGGREIVPARWVADSIKAWSDASAYGAGGYGYMWWVDKNSYSARGAGGHYLVVVPEMNLVVVHRVDTFVPDNSVGAREFYKLLDLIVEAGGRKDLTPAAEATTAPPCRQPDSTCGERLYLGDKHIVFYRSHSPQTGRHPGVRRAFVLVHGASRNGDAYFGVALASAAAAGRLDDTVLIAPHFRANAAGCRDKTEPAEYGWTCEDWKTGSAAANSSADRPAHSFDFVDAITGLLNNRARFPDLAEIVIAGHSAGGQFVQRYAATTQTNSRLPVRYFVANPSSYMYLNGHRLSRLGSCDQEGNCSGSFQPFWDAANCTTFNRYKHGLESLTGYAAQPGAAAIVSQFPTRDVTYLAGALDTQLDSNLESTCGANAQGRNRMERGIIYWNYMRRQFRAEHKLAVIGGCGHSATCMFASPATLRLLFPKMSGLSSGF